MIQKVLQTTRTWKQVLDLDFLRQGTQFELLVILTSPTTFPLLNYEKFPALKVKHNFLNSNMQYQHNVQLVKFHVSLEELLHSLQHLK